MTRPSLSICTFCSEPASKEFPFEEVILSALPIADEIIVVNGDQRPNSETDAILSSIGTGNIKVYHNPWEPRMRRNMMVLQKSLAISHATKDYVLVLDGDEVLHEDDYPKIRKAISLDYAIYTLRVIHFYKDYNTIKIARSGDQWYERRPVLFKNNLGIFDGYRYIPEEDRCRYTSDLTTWNYEPIMDFAKHTSIRIFHYGWVRSDRAMLEKQNAIEKRHHPDFEGLKEWKWDLSNTEIFDGTHPKPMLERTRQWNRSQR